MYFSSSVELRIFCIARHFPLSRYFHIQIPAGYYYCYYCLLLLLFLSYFLVVLSQYSKCKPDDVTELGCQHASILNFIVVRMVTSSFDPYR